MEEARIITQLSLLPAMPTARDGTLPHRSAFLFQGTVYNHSNQRRTCRVPHIEELAMESKLTRSLMGLGLLAGSMIGAGLPAGGVALAMAGVATAWLLRTEPQEDEHA